MGFIDMTPAWDYNDPVRTICIEPRFQIYNGAIRTRFKTTVSWGGL